MELLHFMLRLGFFCSPYSVVLWMKNMVFTEVQGHKSQARPRRQFSQFFEKSRYFLEQEVIRPKAVILGMYTRLNVGPLILYSLHKIYIEHQTGWGKSQHGKWLRIAEYVLTPQKGICMCWVIKLGSMALPY